MCSFSLSRLLGRVSLAALLVGSLGGAVRAAEVQLLADATGVVADTPLETGGGRFVISVPVILNAGLDTPVKPEVEVVDDHNLLLSYPNNAKVKVTLVGSKATVSFSEVPAEAKAASMRMVIHREAYQGSRYAIDQRPLESFPEEDEPRELYAGKAASFTLIDPAGQRLKVQSPGLFVRLENKGPEGWSHNAVSWTFDFADHPNENSFFLDLSHPENKE